ncbi:MAG TPA: hypothetical protein VE732_02100 [Nitrososphaera sp.]|jgi:hypothetical protein|nr:hypothetical protein [Nitrososphaera sp.]
MQKEHVKLSQTDYDFLMTLVSKGKLPPELSAAQRRYWNSIAARPYLLLQKLYRLAVKLFLNGVTTIKPTAYGL